MPNSSAPATPRLTLPGPVGGDDAFPPADLEQLRQRLDLVVTAFDQGSVLPSTVGVKGTLFWAIVERTLYYSDGTTWAPAIPTAYPFPVGAVMMWPSPSNPPGGAEWLEPKGQTIQKAGYGELFGVWGVTAVSLVLPDWRGRSPIGDGQGTGLTARTVGQSGGEETHALVVAELARHNHSIYTTTTEAPAGGFTITAYPQAANWSNKTEPAGSDVPHNNMQPFAVTRFLIRAR